MAKPIRINIKEEFSVNYTLSQVNKVVEQIDIYPNHLDVIREFIFDKDPRKNMRATWLLLHIAFKHPQLVKGEIPVLLKFLDQNNNHTGAIRNCVRIFMELEIPEKYCAPIYDKCQSYVTNVALPHAVRVFAVYAMANICKRFPELKQELLIILDELKKYPQSPSMNACLKKTYKNLLKL
jgi:hypothetical protein